VIITFLIELSIILKGKEWREHPPSWLKNIKIPIRESKWFIIMTSVFIVAIFVWLLWQDTGPLCVPDSWFQGHAIWHFLTALAPFAIYRYLRTEQ
jgi:hypothetical protein